MKMENCIRFLLPIVYCNTLYLFNIYVLFAELNLYIRFRVFFLFLLIINNKL